jgi:hypothetical protein
MPKLEVGGDMHKLLSIIAGLFTKRGHRPDLADEDQDELLDLSEYGTPFEDLPIDHVTPR